MSQQESTTKEALQTRFDSIVSTLEQDPKTLKTLRDSHDRVMDLFDDIAADLERGKTFSARFKLIDRSVTKGFHGPNHMIDRIRRIIKNPEWQSAPVPVPVPKTPPEPIDRAVEPVIKSMDVSYGVFGPRGRLELTPRRLVFSRQPDPANPDKPDKPEFSVDLSAIDGANAIRKFGGGDRLEVIYRDERGTRQTKELYRANWNNDSPNFFDQFAHDIAEIRKELTSGTTRLEQLKQLGELRASGTLTEEEFQTEKARILRS